MHEAPTTIKVPDEGLMALGPKSAIFLFLYYLTALVLAAWNAYSIGLEHAPRQQNAPLFFCMLLAIVGATIFYSRKLYKACISGSYNFDNGSMPQRIGTFFFFLLRPIFAVVFAWVTHMIWEATIISSVDAFQAFSPTHLYFSGVLGFFVGFLAGRILTRMEATGDKYLNGVW